MKAAIFDMDGLLFDTERLYVEGWKKAADEFGVEYQPEFSAEVQGTSGEMMLDVIRKHYPGINVAAFRNYVLDYVEEITKDRVPMKPGVENFLIYCKQQGWKLGIGSNTSIDRVMAKLETSGIAGYFDVVVGGQEVRYGKPDPDIYLLTAQKLGENPKDCYVFDDNVYGVEAGISAGCVTVMIPDLSKPTKEIEEKAAGIYDSLMAVKDAIEAGEI